MPLDSRAQILAVRRDWMGLLEKGLRKRPLVLTLLLAIVVIYGVSTDGIVSADTLPFGDGERYALRAMTLYGFLHTGQWSQFWDVFTFPKQSLAPLHYWLFFLVPQPWAGLTSYGIIQGVTTYVILALGLWALCRELDRPAWTPALFLFCAAQNISLDNSYFYFADIPFLAVGCVALAWQVRAWRTGTWRNSVLSGVGVGLLFWVKAPNAIIFLATYVIAEIVRGALSWRESRRGGATPSTWRDLLIRHRAAIATGLIPVTLLAMACGGFQSIIRQINQNEVADIFATTVQCSGLLRLLYFPLCLSFFYHIEILVLLLIVTGGVAFLMSRGPATVAFSPGVAFPGARLLPLVVAYFILGEFFSFGEASKGMRSLLMLLPVFWLAIFWVLERCRIRPGLVFLAAVAYVGCAFSQVLFDSFGTMDLPTEGYQLGDDWLARLPQCHAAGIVPTQNATGLLQLINQVLPDGGKVAVGSEQMGFTSESLTWAAQHDLALRGQRTPFVFENFLAADGKYCRSALLHARVIVVYTNPHVQYSRAVANGSLDLIRFITATWRPDGTAQIFPVGVGPTDLLGAIIVTEEPLSSDKVTQLIEGTRSVELPPNSEFNAPTEHRLTWAECFDILRQWKEKRLGR
jgi:hypothetical protein